MKLGIIVGKSVRSYEKDGEQKMARTLHVLWDEPRQQQDGEQGRKVEAVFCRFDISNIQVGDHCDFIYAIEQFGGRTVATLAEIQTVGKAKIDIKIEPVKAV